MRGERRDLIEGLPRDVQCVHNLFDGRLAGGDVLLINLLPSFLPLRENYRALKGKLGGAKTAQYCVFGRKNLVLAD